MNDYMELTVSFPWKPRAKQRARGGNGHHYTPPATRAAEAAARSAFLTAVGPDFEPFTGLLAVELELTKDGVGMHISQIEQEKRVLRGDLDNYTKCLWDALNGVAWGDDRQIARMATKELT